MKRLKAFSEKLKSKWANRKRLAPSVRCLLEIVAILAVYLAIALPIHYQFAVFSWHWFAFGLMALLFPCSFIYGKVYVENRQAFTKEQSQRANLLLAGRILFYWLADCAYMAIFNDWTVWICILCGITLVVVFWNLVRAFLGQAQKGGIFGLSLLLDFLVGVGLTIYLLSLITNPNLQQIITSVVAAIFGGVFTLVGVAWTIRKGDEDRKTDRLQVEADRKEEERKKYRPFMELQKEIPARMVRASKLKGINCNDPKYVKNGEAHIFSTLIKDFNIKNISESNIILEGVVVDNEYCAFDHVEIVAKGEAIQIQTTRNFMLPLGSANVRMDLIVSDILGNNYKLNCVLERLSEHAGILVAEHTDSKAIYYPQSFYIAAVTLPILMEEMPHE